MFDISGSKIVVESVDGNRWSSNWGRRWPSADPGSRPLQSGPNHRPKFYGKRSNTSCKCPSDPSLLTAYHEVKTTTVTAEDRDFAVPDVGICRLISSHMASAVCRSPLRQPPSMKISTVSDSHCSSSEENQDSLHPDKIWSRWHWNQNSELTEFGISPVEVLPINFWERSDAEKMIKPRICKGTPITFTIYDSRPPQRRRFGHSSRSNLI